jgi:hypothetical protein
LPLTKQATCGCWNSIIICHDIAMTLARPLRAVVNKTSRFEQLIDLGKDAALSSHWPAVRGSLALYAPTQRISGSFRGIGGGAAFG